MHLLAKLIPVLGGDLVLLHSNTNVVERAEIGRAGAVSLTSSLLEISCCYGFILLDTHTGHIQRSKVEDGIGGTGGGGKLIPVKRARRISPYAKTCLVQIANQILCLGIAAFSRLLIPVRRQFRILCHAVAHQVSLRQQNLLIDKTLFRLRLKLSQVGYGSMNNAGMEINHHAKHEQPWGQTP